MINLIPSMPISFIKSKHPSIFTHIIFKRNNRNNACNKSFNSQGNIAPIRTLAQARRWPSWCSRFSPKRDKLKGVFTNSCSGEMLSSQNTANSRPGETRDSGGFTRSRSGEVFSPERDYASLKTGKGRLGEFSWQWALWYSRLGETSSLGRN